MIVYMCVFVVLYVLCKCACVFCLWFKALCCMACFVSCVVRVC